MHLEVYLNTDPVKTYTKLSSFFQLDSQISTLLLTDVFSPPTCTFSYQSSFSLMSETSISRWLEDTILAQLEY
jgi:hypothetical protein